MEWTAKLFKTTKENVGQTEPNGKVVIRLELCMMWTEAVCSVSRYCKRNYVKELGKNTITINTGGFQAKIQSR
jgi:hypothetical protein